MCVCVSALAHDCVYTFDKRLVGGWVGVGVGVYISDNTKHDATNEILKKNCSTLGCEDMRVGAAVATVVLCCKKVYAREIFFF